MPRFRNICLVLALFGLAGTARAQYYPPYYYPPTPRYLPGYYAPPRPPEPPAAAVATDRVKPVQEIEPLPEPALIEEPLPQFEPEPESILPAEPELPAGPVASRLAGGYTIPYVLASMPYETPKPCSAVWAKAEYLNWWMRNGPPHYPLVTTDSNPGATNAGSLNSPTVSSLFGNDGFDYGAFHGGRLTLGIWFDQENRLGIEGSGFLTETRSVRFHAGSDTTPALYLPAYDLLIGSEGRLIVADPTIPLTGTVDIASTLQLWGAEVNGVYRLLRCSGWNVELLAGFRYLDLLETIDLENTTSGFNQTVFLTDHFQTRNQFYGPQTGVRCDYTYGPFTAGLSGKIALGVTHGVTEVAGYNNDPITGSTPGGFFSQASNMGRTTLNYFSAVPQFALTLGCNVTERVTIFAGYDFLLWTGVERAGDQIDRVLNLSQNASLGTGGLLGVARPEALNYHSDFWAQGISVGVQFRY